LAGMAERNQQPADWIGNRPNARSDSQQTKETSATLPAWAEPKKNDFFGEQRDPNTNWQADAGDELKRVEVVAAKPRAIGARPGGRRDGDGSQRRVNLADRQEQHIVRLVVEAEGYGAPEPTDQESVRVTREIVHHVEAQHVVAEF